MATVLKQSAVRIYRNEENCLGVGSYGAVYKAKLHELPCAAKILHPTLFHGTELGSDALLKKFQQECAFLSEIHHPHIVQYLGTCKDPATGMMILITEMLDENLTSFLERSTHQLPYCIQLDICHDMSLAIAYLHSNNIVHRDLSSNNVLMMAGRRAKVSDFGMSKLMHANATARQTYCPGTEVYMPPEAFKDPPDYSNKIDCFSIGPLILQILTQLFPKPGPRTEQVPFHRSPTGTIEMPILETD